MYTSINLIIYFENELLDIFNIFEQNICWYSWLAIIEHTLNALNYSSNSISRPVLKNTKKSQIQYAVGDLRRGPIIRSGLWGVWIWVNVRILNVLIGHNWNLSHQHYSASYLNTSLYRNLSRSAMLIAPSLAWHLTTGPNAEVWVNSNYPFELMNWV